ncbi:MAG: coproporphyrinogen III oxidase [Alphaproteobacteria bacterium]|nr:coproporphyrinogen III oxidase [Alphaproteobacteria bacterium]
MISSTVIPLAIYIHWPFCLSKCPYCDFNSHVRERIEQDAWREGLLRELKHYAALLPDRLITSIFFGGGTPSLMPTATVAALIRAVRDQWATTDDCEITLEANPTSVEAENFAALREAGVNRVSLGIQSLQDEALRFLGRQHSAGQALAALQLAAQTFPRFSFDLIYARAGQTSEAWATELKTALSYARGHLSLYQLTIEENTQFHTRAGRGEHLASDSESAAALYEQTQILMQAAGLPAYEISNHAAAGQESRHNLAYWHYDDYIGIGAGAHGRYVDSKGVRTATVGKKVPEAWLQQVRQQEHGLVESSTIDAATARREALMMGLRLTTGIDRAGWLAKFGQDVSIDLAPERIARLNDEGLLQCTATHFVATAAGRTRLNALLRYLLG